MAIPSGTVFRRNQPTLGLLEIRKVFIFLLKHDTQGRCNGESPDTFFALGLANKSFRVFLGSLNGGADKYLMGFKIHAAFEWVLGIINLQGNLLANS